MLWGWTLKAFKTSGNWGYLIKRPSGQQGVKLNNFIYYVLFSYVINGFLFRTNEDHNKIRDGKP